MVWSIGMFDMIWCMVWCIGMVWCNGMALVWCIGMQCNRYYDIMYWYAVTQYDKVPGLAEWLTSTITGAVGDAMEKAKAKSKEDPHMCIPLCEDISSMSRCTSYISAQCSGIHLFRARSRSPSSPWRMSIPTLSGCLYHIAYISIPYCMHATYCIHAYTCLYHIAYMSISYCIHATYCIHAYIIWQGSQGEGQGQGVVHQWVACPRLLGLQAPHPGTVVMYMHVVM